MDNKTKGGSLNIYIVNSVIYSVRKGLVCAKVCSYHLISLEPISVTLMSFRIEYWISGLSVSSSLAHGLSQDVVGTRVNKLPNFNSTLLNSGHFTHFIVNSVEIVFSLYIVAEVILMTLIIK